MLNVGKIEEGFVLDHIPAGKSMSIYYHLGLDKLDCPCASMPRKQVRTHLASLSGPIIQITIFTF